MKLFKKGCFTFTVVDNPTFSTAKGDVNIDESIDVADVSAVNHIIEATTLDQINNTPQIIIVILHQYC